jgi:multimeric flavodoxin WrbA
MTAVRKGQGSVDVDQDTFRRRFRARFFDPVFDARPASDKVDELADLAWEAYRDSRKAPRTRAAGSEFADPSYQLSVEWLAARDAIRDAARAHADASSPSRVLLVCGGARSGQTCPGEMSKTFRLTELARQVVAAADGFEADVLDLSRLTSEYGRVIYPCKACVSTAMPLCHWPCSCYPNNALGQVNDWMNEIYPRWVAAHGILIVSPVYWYQAPSPLKLMMDRLVCADGGNPDPTSTGGKDPARAKQIELAGWSYPRHLAGRAFGVVVHGDAEGVENLRRSLADWLQDMELVPAGAAAELGRYIGYYEPYATSHDALDADDAINEEVRNAARTVVAAVQLLRAGQPLDATNRAGVRQPRPK